MTKLTDEALDFAKAHIDHFYDSDFFPKPTVYDVIFSDWDTIKSALKKLDVGQLPPEQPRALPAPKKLGGYRVVHQLEPLDAIKYTALVRMVAEHVEKNRPAATLGVAYSYRIAPDSNGGFFTKGNGYPEFLQRCKALSSTHAYVLSADIADFYNSIYTHRLNNNISFGDPSKEKIAKDIEVLITKLNAQASRGIPIGPAASIVVAEAVMFDIDQYIMGEGFPHCRYVDDIRVFSDDKAQLEKLEEKLSFYAYQTHRLHLSTAKTRIETVAEFTTRIEPPQTAERRELLDICGVVCEYGDTFTEADLDSLEKKYLSDNDGKPASTSAWAIRFFEMLEKSRDREKQLVRTHVLEAVWDEGLRGDHLDLGLVRHALRQGRRFKTPVLFGRVINQFERMGPVLADAFLYLNGVATDDLLKVESDDVAALLSSPLANRSRLATHWLHWFCSCHAVLLGHPAISAHLRKEASVEHQARAAIVSKDLAWVRAKKTDMSSLGTWDRYAVLEAAKIMPKDEREAWTKAVNPRDTVEEILLKSLRK